MIDLDNKGLYPPKIKFYENIIFLIEHKECQYILSPPSLLKWFGTVGGSTPEAINQSIQTSIIPMSFIYKSPETTLFYQPPKKLLGGLKFQFNKVKFK